MKEKLYQLLQNKFRVSSNLLDGTHDDDPLTGEVFRFSGIDLTYLFLETEKMIGRKIDTTKILHYEFNTINGICKVIGE